MIGIISSSNNYTINWQRSDQTVMFAILLDLLSSSESKKDLIFLLSLLF
jgi:hypothetical protein